MNDGPGSAVVIARFRAPCRRPTGNRGEGGVTGEEIKAWAMQNGWQIIGGHPSLTKRSSPKEAIVRLVMKATVVHLEARKPAGKWEKIGGQSYEKILADEETGAPVGLGFEAVPGIRMLMQANRDRQAFSAYP
jgi:hypothetical protein